MQPTSTIKTIAGNLGLSACTVSIVLNGRGDEMRIAKKTQERVMDEAKALGYRPNIYARRLRHKSPDGMTAVIGVLWPSHYSADLVVRFFDGIRETVLDDKLNAEIIYRPYSYAELYKTKNIFENNLFNGVILVGASDSDIEYVEGESFNVPIVLFNRQSEKYCSVGIDDYKVGCMAAELFHARGHKNVGLVESLLPVRSHAMRRVGFVESCKKLGLTLSPDNIVKCGGDEDGGIMAAKKFLKSKAFPTAIHFTIGGAAPGVYPVFTENGVVIPDDVELLEYGDTALNRLIKPNLTVIDFPVQRMVKRCVHLITDMLAGKLQEPVNIYEDTNFIIRESCGYFPEK